MSKKVRAARPKCSAWFLNGSSDLLGYAIRETYDATVAILINPYSRVPQWRQEFEALLADEDLRWYPDIGDPADIEFVVAWLMSRSELSELPNLEAILCLGAGTEQWQKPGMPDVPVVRLADPAMADQMAAYAVSYVVRHQRGFAGVEAAQSERGWAIPETPQTWSYPVGILGHGTIGARIGEAFATFGYPVNAWTRTRRDTPGVTHYAGSDELDAFLGASSVVINVLPSTESTTGLLTKERFDQFAPDSLFVNVGRGTVIESDLALVGALDDGPLAAAILDVTSPEPLLEDSPLWNHPAVTLTPHLSGVTQVRSAAQVVAANIARFRAGETVGPLLDRSRGY